MRTRSLRYLLWSIGLFASLMIVAPCMGSEQPAAASVKKLIVPDDHATVQAAILAAGTGDTVFIKPGTYHEAIDLKSGIKLVGEQMDKVTLQFGDSKSVITVNDCNDVSISGLTVRHMTTSRGLGGNAGIAVNNSTVVLAHCRITEAASSGIDIANKADATIDSCIIDGNGARGIEIKNSTGVIRACEVARNAVLGIVLIGRQTRGTVRYCRITESKFAGLGFWLGASGTAEENEIHDNTVGIEVRDTGTDVVLTKNHCHNNKRDGIQIFADAGARAEQNLCE